MPCTWKIDVRCFMGHINMPYSLGSRAKRGSPLPHPTPTAAYRPCLCRRDYSGCTNFCNRPRTDRPTSEEQAPALYGEEFFLSPSAITTVSWPGFTTPDPLIALDSASVYNGAAVLAPAIRIRVASNPLSLPVYARV